MSNQEKSSPKEKTEQNIVDSFEAVFENPVGNKVYSLNPHTNTLARWIFEHSAFLCLLLIISVLFVTLMLVLQAEDEYYRNWIIEQIGYVSIPVLGCTFIVLLMLRRFMRNVPKTFLDLAKSGRLKPAVQSNDNSNQDVSILGQRLNSLETYWVRLQHRFSLDHKNWQSYAGDFEKAVRSPWGFIFFIIFLIFGLVIAYFIRIELPELESDNIWPNLLWFLNLVIAPIFLAYLVGYYMWILFVVAIYIRWLTPTFKLDIQPEHLDHCGGLKKLGDLCFGIGWHFVLPAFLIGFYLMINTTPAFTFLVYSALFVLIGFATIAIFWPMLNIHNYMVEEKERYNDEAISRIVPKKSALRELIGTDEATAEEIKNLEEQLIRQMRLYPADLQYPTWPITANKILWYYIPQIVPIFTMVKIIINAIIRPQ